MVSLGPSNQPPVISGTPPTGVTVGSNLDFTPTASDPDGNPLVFDINGLPAWANFDVNSGRLSGVPSGTDVGTYPNISISVSDGAVTAVLPLFTINVVGNGPLMASCVRLVALSEINGNPWTSAAEIDVLDSLGQRIAKSQWTLIAVDSEEVLGEDGRGSNALDGSINTRWTTEWSQSSPPPPHQIEFHLGSQQALTGLEYLPRQDGNVNGTIAQFETYVSQDCSSWLKVSGGNVGGQPKSQNNDLRPQRCKHTASGGCDLTIRRGEFCHGWCGDVYWNRG